MTTRSATTLACLACLLTSCGDSGGGGASKVTLVHSYGGTASDSVQTSIILGSDGNFYAAAYFGGANGEYQQRSSWDPNPFFVPNSAGSLSRIDPAGVSTVLWNFGSSPADGLNPSSLIEGMDGNFYGTTTNGGSSGTLFPLQEGTVFQYSRSGVEKILWSFSDALPLFPLFPRSLIQATDGNFYGVTSGGGVLRDVLGIFNGQLTDFKLASGTVFKVTPQGVMTILWNFAADNDGAEPSRLIQGADGNLYGITAVGGEYGHGTVFKITLDRTETVLWSFCGPGDGCNPITLIQGTDGNLYGTTGQGPNSSNGGTVFRLSVTGVLTTLLNFSSSQQQYLGYFPIELIEGTDGYFYGTTFTGGLYCPANGNCKGRGGTLFRVSPAGTPAALWAFGHGTDGNSPHGLVWGADGHLYGVTNDGGEFGKGSLFRY